jgi:hypothetical protein
MLGLAHCPASSPRLLLRDFSVEPIPPHAEEWVLVHEPDLPHRPEAVNRPIAGRISAAVAVVGRSTLQSTWLVR